MQFFRTDGAVDSRQSARPSAKEEAEGRWKGDRTSGKRPWFVGGMKTRSGREKKKLNKLRADGLFDLGKLRGGRERTVT
jgi:hypothetical protein